jgi:hypothetical protein
LSMYCTQPKYPKKLPYRSPMALLTPLVKLTA